MEIQALLPQAKTICLKKICYEKPNHIMYSEQGVDVARIHNIELYCNVSDNNSVILPTIMTFDSLKSGSFPIKDFSTELIMSHHYMSEGLYLCIFSFYSFYSSSKLNNACFVLLLWIL